MSGLKRISIVIPAWRAEETISSAVSASIAQQWEGGSIEVLVVDDGSPDRTADRAEAAGARVLRQGNAGPASARNRGWKEARGEWIFFTDSDCAPEPDWVATLARHLEDDSVGAAGGSYSAANGDRTLAACIQAEIEYRHSSMKGDVRFLGSFNLAIKRTLLEETGGFDESYRDASGEDNDLSYRLRIAGYRLRFDPEARVSHIHPVRLERYLKEQARHGFWRMKLYSAHPSRISGDDYSGPVDFLEPPVALALLCLAPLAGLPFVPSIIRVGGFFLVFLAGWMTWRLVRFTGDPRLFWFFPVRLLRAFARGLGLAAGVWRFWILRRVIK